MKILNLSIDITCVLFLSFLISSCEEDHRHDDTCTICELNDESLICEYCGSDSCCAYIGTKDCCCYPN